MLRPKPLLKPLLLSIISSVIMVVVVVVVVVVAAAFFLTRLLLFFLLFLPIDGGRDGVVTALTTVRKRDHTRRMMF
jgi:hypothetical protein